MSRHLAVDLGASGGRVIAGEVGRERLGLTEVHRFPNVPVHAGGTLHWDVLRLYRDMLDGLRAACAGGQQAASAGIDSWAVDYGLLDESGALLGNPVHYRDARTSGVTVPVPAAELYATTGIQQMPFNTLCQLLVAAGTPQLEMARTLLMIPDLFGYWLTGQTGTEVTNASTTQLLDVRSRTWAAGLAARLGIPSRLLGPLRQPGDVLGPVLPGTDGLPESLQVLAVASHDTASAVVAVPADMDRTGRGFAYISCGTWSLAGVELAGPVLSEESMLANFTNEAGIDGTVRYLRNIMGLWLLQECLRVWETPLEPLLAAAAGLPRLRAVIDPDDAAFAAPGDMPGRIAAACRATGQPVPAGPAETVRCILDSLALAHRRVIGQAQRLSGVTVDAIHMVGGGSRNELLCQLTADACGLQVIAGPAEAAAVGNILVQARALGSAPAGLDGMRALVRSTQPLRRYLPADRDGAGGGDSRDGGDGAWRAAAGRIGVSDG